MEYEAFSDITSEQGGVPGKRQRQGGHILR
jgi:hypothetical protein